MSISTSPDKAQSYLIQGENVTMPVEIRQASNWTAMFAMPISAAHRVLAPTGLEPIRVLPGKSLAGVGFVRYTDGDLGPYHEFMVALMARRPGVPKSDGAYIHWLPVNQTFTCEAGQEIWGFPKEIADIEITPHRWYTDCRVHLDGKLVVAIRVGNGLPAPSALAGRRIDAYTYRGGLLRRTPWGMSVTGVRARPGGARITWGDHPKAAELQRLQISPRALFSTSTSALQMSFEAADVLS